MPASYLDAGHLDHGYAITGHRAQGLTVDRTWIHASDALYREWGYVAASRGRTANRIYLSLTAADADELDRTAWQPDSNTLASKLSSSRSQLAAADLSATLDVTG